MRDHARPGAKVLFVGINPGMRSALIGHHFAGYSNRFWKLLYDAGLVPEPITCEEDGRLPEWGYGITNLVARPTRSAGELSPSELREACGRLVRKVARLRPRIVALVGLTVYRALFPSARGRVRPGPAPERLAGVPVWVLPNPSGRNANYRYEEMLAAYRALRRAIAREPRRLRRTPAAVQAARGGPGDVRSRTAPG